MSRIGKKPVELPDKVEVNLTGRKVEVKGPKGELSLMLPGTVEPEINANLLMVKKVKNSAQAAADYGLYRQLLSNMVTGVSSGFTKQLEIVGVGYRVAQQGSSLVFNLGYSHPIEVASPEGITLAAQKSTVTVSGIDKAQVGQVAANIRALRKPEPYKGKGVKYAGEKIRRKAGKAGKAAK